MEPVCFERTDDIGGLYRYQATVYSMKKRPYFSTSGQWEAVIECEGKKEVNVFDGVMLCNGHHSNAHLPLESFPGIEKFKGQYFHSQDYKNLEALAGKRVFIIVGNSGGDMVVEISYTTKQFLEKSMNQRFDYEIFGLKPKHRYVLRMGMELIMAKIQEQGLFTQTNKAISTHTLRKSREFEIQFLPYRPQKNKICWSKGILSLILIGINHFF
ncbi:Dimethylaniline monooxygenase [N-oxide-forming] 5 [Sciurus carolinensis]|uniref:Flavin-containing monooxygenase n=1 Tax=Sciurus carolinensis TaxID=30640 RepID=A0AA41MEN5_SCICA|nr:Dimethylaniline monooxygenase [N-oxide-forming] 5 [Sciurus carolinensis]